MNTLGAAAVEGDLTQPAQTNIFWKNYSSLLCISLDINSPPIEPKTVAKSVAIIGRAPPFLRIKCRLDAIDYLRSTK